MPTPPVTEQGTTLDIGSVGLTFPGLGTTALSPKWASFVSEVLEHVPELKWPQSIQTYHTMRNDAQIQGLFLGSTLPIRRYNWYLEPNGARKAVVNSIARDYNIPVRGKEDEPRGRTKQRFKFQDHLRHALLALVYGHMFFEQVGDIGTDDLWHLRKLGPRMPQSIQEILVDRQDGGLAGIRQYGMGLTRNGIDMLTRPIIPVEKLVAYVWEQEGGNWTGRSMLRGIFKNWLLKDTVLRVGAINIERAGGVPVIEGPKGATADDLKALATMAKQFRIGEGSGGAIPNGSALTLARAAGGEEAVNFVKLMNEEMGRGWLMMFMNLGQATTGSYALGSSLIDYVLNTQETIASWFCDVFNEHVIEDHVDWNWGEDEQAPLLVYTRNDDRQLAIADLMSMIDGGLIVMDDELESWIREEYSMPRKTKDFVPRAKPTSPAVAPSGPTQAERKRTAAGLEDSPTMPSSDKLYDHEKDGL